MLLYLSVVLHRYYYTKSPKNQAKRKQITVLLLFRKFLCNLRKNMPLWWNWQTRGTQNPVVAIPCRFDPDQRHQNQKRGQQFLSFGFGNTLRVRTRQVYLPSFVYLRKQIFAEGSYLLCRRETAIPDLSLTDRKSIRILFS